MVTDDYALIGIDPGGVHCGVSVWGLPEDNVWSCLWVEEFTPEQCVDFVKTQREWNPALHVACESFFLRPGKAALQQIGSAFPTVEVIGSLRNICRWWGSEPLLLINPTDRSATYDRLRGAGYRFAGKAQSKDDHRVSAECVAVGAMKFGIRNLKI